MPKRIVILRADGNGTIGLGHVYRLLALAEMIKDDFECVFAINFPDEFVRETISGTCSSIIELRDLIYSKPPSEFKAGEEIEFDLGNHLSGSELVITDGYLFGEKYQRAVKATGAKLICVDDHARHRFCADMVINHAPGVKASMYDLSADTILLCGLDYAMIREAFFKPFPEKHGSAKTAYISLGGSDHLKLTGLLLQYVITGSSFEKVHVLTSSSFRDELLSNLNGIASSNPRVFLHHNLAAEQLVEIMDKCTHAFVAASTVLVESYSRGLKCFAGYYTDNQQYIYNGFVEEKLAIGMGDLHALSYQKFVETVNKEELLQAAAAPLISSKKLKDFFQTNYANTVTV